MAGTCYKEYSFKNAWNRFVFYTSYYPFSLPSVFPIWVAHFYKKYISNVIFIEYNNECLFPIIKKHLCGCVRFMQVLIGKEIYYMPLYFKERLNENPANITEYFISQNKKWDILRVHYARQCDMIQSKIQMLNNNIPFFELSTRRVAVIYIHGTFDEYLEKVCSKKDIKETLRIKRKAEKERQVEYKIYAGANVTHGLAEAYDVSTRSWKALEKTNIGGDNIYGAFYRDIFAALSDKITVHIISFNNKPVSFTITCVHEGTCFIMKTGYDMEYKNYRLGGMVFYNTLQYVFSQKNIKKIDFITDYSYLKTWVNEYEIYQSFIAFNKTIAGLVSYVLLKCCYLVKKRAGLIWNRCFKRSIT